MNSSNCDYIVQYSYITGNPCALDCVSGLVVAEDVDATPVIQYCLDKGGKIYVAEGQYSIRAPLIVKFSYTSLLGAGGNTVLDFDGSTVPTLISLAADDLVTKAFCFFERMRIRNTTTPGQGKVFDFTNLTLCKVADVWIEGVKIGIEFTGSRCLYNCAENVRIGIIGPDSCAIRIVDRANHTRISNARILPDVSLPAPSIGVYVQEASVIELSSVDVEHNALYAMDFAAKSSHCCIINCWLEGNQTNVRLQAGATGITFIGGAISAAKITNVEEQQGATNTTFVNTRIQYRAISKINGISLPPSPVDGIANEVNLNGASLLNAKIKGLQATTIPFLSQVKKGFFEVWENTTTGEVKLVYHSVNGDKLRSVKLT